MIHYFILDANGQIIQYGQCNVESELPSGAQLGEVPNGATHYVDGEFETRENIDLLALKAIERRNAMLIASDWTQLADVQVDKEAWATYRQHLRDIPAQAGFPITIDWGVAP